MEGKGIADAPRPRSGDHEVHRLGQSRRSPRHAPPRPWPRTPTPPDPTGRISYREHFHFCPGLLSKRRRRQRAGPSLRHAGGIGGTGCVGWGGLRGGEVGQALIRAFCGCCVPRSRAPSTPIASNRASAAAAYNPSGRPSNPARPVWQCAFAERGRAGQVWPPRRLELRCASLDSLSPRPSSSPLTDRSPSAVRLASPASLHRVRGLGAQRALQIIGLC